jgi:D-glycero-D-manno-heptose 1,7-bisphosphate phosphatase
VVATNQSGIGRGLYTAQQFLQVSEWMRACFDRAGAPLAGVYYCPHHPTDAIDGFRVRCDCRKPQPGMLLAAAADLSLDLDQSMMFGDTCEDLQAAHAAGITQRVLLGKNGRLPPRDDCPPNLATARFANLREAVASNELAPILGGAIDA